MSRPIRPVPVLCVLLMAVVTNVAATTQAQTIRLPAPPNVTLTSPGVELPEEPERHFGWSIAVMSAGTVMAATGGFAAAYQGLSNLCLDLDGGGCMSSGHSRDRDSALVIPFAMGTALIAIGLAWFITQVVQFRRAHRAFEEGTPRLAW